MALRPSWGSIVVPEQNQLLRNAGSGSLTRGRIDRDPDEQMSFLIRNLHFFAMIRSIFHRFRRLITTQPQLAKKENKGMFWVLTVLVDAAAAATGGLA